mgnify:CR=1 FL=1
MQDAILRTGDRRLEARVAMFAATARDLFQRIEQDPGDIAATRRYMGVYLQGARDATVKFSDLYAQTRDRTARGEYEAIVSALDECDGVRSRAAKRLGISRTTLYARMREFGLS